MKWLGLTGGIASGKTTVAKQLEQSGIPVVYADQLAREVTQVGSPGLNQIAKKFGKKFLNPDGSLNRVELGKAVFADSEQLKTLEEILHPLIKARTAEIREALATQGKKFAIYDVPLLFEKKLEKQFDEVILVYCEERLQKERLFKRDMLDIEEIEKRLRSQLPLRDKISMSDYVLYNGGNLTELSQKVQELIAYLNKKYS